MRAAISYLLFTVVFCAGASIILGADSKHDRDVAECRKAPPLVQHPADVKKAKAKQDGFNACMASRGYAVGKIRAK